MSKHTPGPWHWDGDIGVGQRLLSASGPVIQYADYEGMWLARYDAEEDEANARLIASAPQLLEERDWYRNALEHIAGACEGHAAETARAALAKYSGGQP